MKINFTDKTGTVKENFIQSLVLLYLPCESFSVTDSGENSLTVTAYFENDTYFADVSLKVSDRCAHANMRVSKNDSKKLQMKNLIGRAFLNAAEQVFGYKSPFGLFTGIRPAKIAADYLRNNSAEETKRILCEEYLFMPMKADMCIRTAENEMRLTDSLADRTCSLYISVPFCPSKCRYCSFVSSTTQRLLSLIPEYLDAMCNELADIGKTVRDLGLELKTIYVGGGTPAILEAEQIKKLTHCVSENFNLDGVDEFTFEAGRPDCITKEKLEAVKNGGIDRISINTQTANDEVLKNVGRKHTFADYVRCMNTARQIGIKCINTDLIAGLPGESTDSFFESVNKVMNENPENITIHSFTLKKSSEFKTSSTAEIDANSAMAREMVNYSASRLLDALYEPYYMYRQKNTVGNLDNTGYAKHGTECLYNIYMMGEYHTVFAAGAGAVSKYVSRDRERIERSFCPKYPYEYLDKEKYKGFDRKFAEDFYNNLY